MTAAAAALSIAMGAARPGLLLSVVLADLLVAILYLFAGLVAAAVAALLVPRLRSRWNRLYPSTLICFAVFAGIGVVVNRRVLPAALHPASLAFDLVLLGAVLVLAWAIVYGSGRRIAAVAVAMLVLVAVTWLLSAIGPSTTGTMSDDASKLADLPYVTWTPASAQTDRSGVTRAEPGRCYSGLNLYNTLHVPRASIVDMDGTVLHEWSRDVFDGFSWMHVELTDEGDLLAITYRKGLVRMDWDSNVEWICNIPAHHDFAIDDEDNILVLTRRPAILPVHGLPLPMIDDRITVVSPAGEVQREISIHNIVKDFIPRSRIAGAYRWLLHPAHAWSAVTGGFGATDHTNVDLYHSNTLEIIDRDIDEVFARGRVIWCGRNLDLVAVLDLEKGEVLWTFGPGVLDNPHHPTLLDNGRLLIFDNGYYRKYSRVVEVDTRTKEIVWEYTADPPEDFYSARRGGSQRLPNGNTLIAEADKGRAFEVTPEGDIVWEFYNPAVAKGRRDAIYRFTRLIHPETVSHLNTLR